MKHTAQLATNVLLTLSNGDGVNASIGEWVTFNPGDLIAAGNGLFILQPGRAVHVDSGAMNDREPVTILMSTAKPVQTDRIDQNYRINQLNKLKADNEMGVIPVKFGQDDNSTKWFNLTPAEFEQIKRVLTP